jgi:pimeloyl-ACP methyl ester carboxylesterase
MTTSRDVVLARLAAAAYSDGPMALPLGFKPVSAQALGVSLSPGTTFADGIYHNQNAAALVASGPLNGTETLVLAFRGSDDREDSVNSLRNINADYPDFAPLTAAVDGYAARAGFQQVAVTGHSLGGAMAQLFMADHPEQPGTVHYLADTFGSPGALLADGPDPRIVNYVIADDPAVFLGENRAEAGAALRSNPLLTGAAVFLAVDTFPELTPADALASLASLTVDYENRGETLLLPGAGGSTVPISSIGQLQGTNSGEHRVELYTYQVAVAAAGATGRLPETLFDRQFYLGRNPDVAAAGVDPQAHYDQFGWREGRDPEAAFDTSFYLARNADVVAAGVNPLEHYSIIGWREGRDPNLAFDPDFYLATNPDVAVAGYEPLLHYEVYGWFEGRNPSPGFSTNSYLAHNPDVQVAGINPLEHYVQHGAEEGRLL